MFESEAVCKHGLIVKIVQGFFLTECGPNHLEALVAPIDCNMAMQLTQ